MVKDPYIEGKDIVLPAVVLYAEKCLAFIPCYDISLYCWYYSGTDAGYGLVTINLCTILRGIMNRRRFLGIALLTPLISVPAKAKKPIQALFIFQDNHDLEMWSFVPYLKGIKSCAMYPFVSVFTMEDGSTVHTRLTLLNLENLAGNRFDLIEVSPRLRLPEKERNILQSHLKEKGILNARS